MSKKSKVQKLTDEQYNAYIATLKESDSSSAAETERQPSDDDQNNG